MDESTRFALESKWLRTQQIRLSVEALKQRGKEFVSARIELQNEEVYIALIQDGPKGVTPIKLNAVAAMNLAANILQTVKPIFPDTLKVVEIDHSPPRGDQH